MNWLKAHWRDMLARAPLPMLALAASWGVYSFAALYVPELVAIVQAAAFELTYIGLAVTRDMDDRQRRRATAISVGAVVVSVLYNSLDGLFHRNPAWLAGLPWYAEVAGAVLHGAPLAAVAYLVADLLLHTQPTGAAQQAATTAQLDARLAQAQTDAAQQAATLRERADALAQARASGEEARAAIEQLRRQAAQQAETYAAGLREQEREIARLKEATAQPPDPDSIDLLKVARRMCRCARPPT